MIHTTNRYGKTVLAIGAPNSQARKLIEEDFENIHELLSQKQEWVKVEPHQPTEEELTSAALNIRTLFADTVVWLSPEMAVVRDSVGQFWFFKVV